MTSRRTNKPRRHGPEAALVKFLEGCDPTDVRVYGPYAPHPGRSTWRVQVWDPATQRKRSLTARSQAEAIELKARLESQLTVMAPLSCHQAIDLFAEHKLCSLRNARDAENIRIKLHQLVPDVILNKLDQQLANQSYVSETQRVGKFGVLKPATHHSRLRLARECWTWLIKQGHTTENPWQFVDSIGKANSGKAQPTHDEALKLQQYLKKQASEGDEGALALLVQLYLGLRPSEVLGLTVGDCSQRYRLVRVNGTKTANAKRELELVGFVADLLETHCTDLQPASRIFAANLASQPAANWMLKRMHRACEAAGIREYCAHSLRGLHSSLALRAGASTHDVARALGHASFSTTQKHYVKPGVLEQSRAREVAKHLDSDGSEERSRLHDLLNHASAETLALLATILNR